MHELSSERIQLTAENTRSLAHDDTGISKPLVAVLDRHENVRLDLFILNNGRANNRRCDCITVNYHLCHLREWRKRGPVMKFKLLIKNIPDIETISNVRAFHKKKHVILNFE